MDASCKKREATSPFRQGADGPTNGCDRTQISRTKGQSHTPCRIARTPCANPAQNPNEPSSSHPDQHLERERDRERERERASDPKSTASWGWTCRKEGLGERDVGVRRRVSDNRQESNPPRLARAPRGGVRGPRPPALPATFAGRPVRRTRASCSPSPGGVYAVYLVSLGPCS
jgi:hypothetical protein